MANDFTNKVTLSNCIEIMKQLPENSVDTIITDPPYLLEFMGCDFDSQHKDMPGANDGQKMQAWHSLWVKEALRVTKSGGYMLAFGGTRTSHRLASALEDAGWIIKDTISWIHSQGFPKSQDIGKVLDKKAGVERTVIGKAKWAERGAISAEGSNEGWKRPSHKKHSDRVDTEPSTEAAKTWDGYGTALKPSFEPIILAMKPLDGTYAENALKHGVAGLNIDGSRLAFQGDKDFKSATFGAQTDINGANYNTNRPSDGKVLATNVEADPKGRWPSNTLFSHHLECILTGTKKVKGTVPHPVFSNKDKYRGWGNITNKHGEIINKYEDKDGFETVEEWHCHPDCPVHQLNEQVGICKSGFMAQNQHRSQDGGYHGGFPSDRIGAQDTYGDTGSASRFFYCAKADTGERVFYCHDCKGAVTSSERIHHQGHNIEGHPTQKPLELMEWLCRLTKTPTGGVILDPFLGTGTTALAAIKTGRPFIGIEMSEIYVAIANKRIEMLKGNMQATEIKHPTTTKESMDNLFEGIGD